MKKMKHIKEWNAFSINENIDNILDKMSRGEGLTPDDKEKMQSYSSHLQKGGHSNDFDFKDKRVFTDDNGYFKFTLDSIEDYGDETHYIGTIECPDYTYGDGGETIPGILEGRIVVTSEGLTSPDFCYENTGLEIFDFCEGLEYELDSFIDYVVSELENEN